MIVIVNQKKTRVMECKRIERHYNEITAFEGTDRYTLGTYENEKRAEEVFRAIITEIEITTNVAPFYAMPKE